MSKEQLEALQPGGVGSQSINQLGSLIQGCGVAHGSSSLRDLYAGPAAGRPSFALRHGSTCTRQLSSCVSAMSDGCCKPKGAAFLLSKAW